MRGAVMFLALVTVAAALRGDVEKMPTMMEVVDDMVAMVEVSATTGAQQAPARSAGIRGDMTIQGSLLTSVLTSPVGDMKVTGTLEVTQSITAGSVLGSFMKVNGATSVTSSIASKGEELQVLGKIDADSITANGVSSSFLEIDGVKQWQLVSISDFEEESSKDGWSHTDVTECAGNKFLGGPCTNTGSSDVHKTFDNLPEHTQIRVSAKYLFIDSWDGESAYMKVDNRVAWADSYNHAEVVGKGINICGNETPEGRYMRNIDVTIPHTGSAFDLTFGATTDEHACDESYGVDNIMIFVR